MTQLECDFNAIGRFGPGYTCPSWRESLAIARARASIRQRRFKVWGYKRHTANGGYEWLYQYGSYAPGVPRGLTQVGCTTCGLVGSVRTYCSSPYHNKPKAVQEYIELYGEEGEVEICGAKATVKIST